MRNCWKTEPRDRIRFADIYEKLAKTFENFEDKIAFENELKQKCSSLKSVDWSKLPRPPPIPLIPTDLLDAQGYLLPKEVKEPSEYLETLPD